MCVASCSYLLPRPMGRCLCVQARPFTCPSPEILYNKMEKVCRFCTADSLPVRMTQLVLFVLAGLVGNAAAGLAGRLAGSLALAAAALLRTCTQITRLQCLNPLHNTYPPNIIISGVAKRPPFCTQSIPYRQGQVNEKNLKRKSFFRAPHGNR